MGALVDRFLQECVCCREVAIPFLIRGRYKDGQRLILLECPTCGYIVRHGTTDPLTKMQESQEVKPPIDIEQYGGLTRRLLHVD